MRLIALVVTVVIAVIFAIQNTDMATVSLLWWEVRASLAVIMVLCVSIGMLFGLAVLAPLLYRGRDSARQLKRRLAEMEAVDADRKARSTQGPADVSANTHPNNH